VRHLILEEYAHTAKQPTSSSVQLTTIVLMPHAAFQTKIMWLHNLNRNTKPMGFSQS